MQSIEQCPVPLLQSAGEFGELLDLYVAVAPRTVLEIGSLYGGTLWHWLRLASPGALVLNIDAVVCPQDSRYAAQRAGHDGLWAQWASSYGVGLKTFTGLSTDPAILAQVQAALASGRGTESTVPLAQRQLPTLDFLFIDGDHTYAGVKSDYMQYGPLVRPGGLIALHDILDRPTSQVARLWQEIVDAGRATRELIESPDQPEMGIGVVFV